MQYSNFSFEGEGISFTFGSLELPLLEVFYGRSVSNPYRGSSHTCAKIKSHLKGGFFILVEARGIEPLSENH